MGAAVVVARIVVVAVVAVVHMVATPVFAPLAEDSLLFLDNQQHGHGDRR